MNRIKRSRRGLTSIYADFIQKENNYQWGNWTEDKLVALLRECVQYDERIVEAYSILKEIIRRKIGLTLFDTQLMAAYSMQLGRIAELPTGEGKTLAAVVKCTPKVRQYGILNNDWGALLCQKGYQTSGTRRSSSDTS